MGENVVQDMHELTTRILKNRKYMEQNLSEKVPCVEAIMAEKPLPPWFDGSGSIIKTIRFEQKHVTLRQSFYYELDGRYFKYTDKFFARPEILPEHIREKVLNFGNEFDFISEVDITEEINHELSAL